MRAGRTCGGLWARLARLERHAAAAEPLVVKVRFGNIRRLPPDYAGERHVAITKQLPNNGNQEWVEYEEVPGPDPSPPEKLTHAPLRYVNVIFVGSTAGDTHYENTEA